MLHPPPPPPNTHRTEANTLSAGSLTPVESGASVSTAPQAGGSEENALPSRNTIAAPPRRPTQARSHANAVCSRTALRARPWRRSACAPSCKSPPAPGRCRMRPGTAPATSRDGDESGRKEHNSALERCEMECRVVPRAPRTARRTAERSMVGSGGEGHRGAGTCMCALLESQ